MPWSTFRSKTLWTPMVHLTEGPEGTRTKGTKGGWKKCLTMVPCRSRGCPGAHSEAPQGSSGSLPPSPPPDPHPLAPQGLLLVRPLGGLWRRRPLHRPILPPPPSPSPSSPPSPYVRPLRPSTPCPSEHRLVMLWVPFFFLFVPWQPQGCDVGYDAHVLAPRGAVHDHHRLLPGGLHGVRKDRRRRCE